MADPRPVMRVELQNRVNLTLLRTMSQRVYLMAAEHDRHWIDRLINQVPELNHIDRIRLYAGEALDTLIASTSDTICCIVLFYRQHAELSEADFLDETDLSQFLTKLRDSGSNVCVLSLDGTRPYFHDYDWLKGTGGQRFDQLNPEQQEGTLRALSRFLQDMPCVQEMDHRGVAAAEEQTGDLPKEGPERSTGHSVPHRSRVTARLVQIHKLRRSGRLRTALMMTEDTLEHLSSRRRHRRLELGQLAAELEIQLGNLAASESRVRTLHKLAEERDATLEIRALEAYIAYLRGEPIRAKRGFSALRELRQNFGWRAGARGSRHIYFADWMVRRLEQIANPIWFGLSLSRRRRRAATEMAQRLYEEKLRGLGHQRSQRVTAIDLQLLGQIKWLWCELGDLPQLSEACNDLDAAEQALIAGGSNDLLPALWLARAKVLRSQAGIASAGGVGLDRKQIEAAHALLLRAREEAEQQSLILVRAEILLEEARLTVATQTEEAADRLALAERVINAIGYGALSVELDRLKNQKRIITKDT